MNKSSHSNNVADVLCNMSRKPYKLANSLQDKESCNENINRTPKLQEKQRLTQTQNRKYRQIFVDSTTSIKQKNKIRKTQMRNYKSCKNITKVLKTLKILNITN